MLTARLIVCLDVAEGRVVKGVRFRDLRDAGDPVALAERYDAEGADEVVFLDVAATPSSRCVILDVVREVSNRVFVPLTVGGGVRSVADAREILRAGADKVSVCSAAIDNPGLLTSAAEAFGSQCVVLSVDAARSGEGWHAYRAGGRKDTGMDAVAWAARGAALGAGEILLNSIDRDGTGVGYDLELTRRVAEAVGVPVIASGGGATPEQMHAALTAGAADAVLVASAVHDRTRGLAEIKAYLAEKGIRVRCSSPRSI